MEIDIDVTRKRLNDMHTYDAKAWDIVRDDLLIALFLLEKTAQQNEKLNRYFDHYATIEDSVAQLQNEIHWLYSELNESRDMVERLRGELDEINRLTGDDNTRQAA